MGTCACHEDLEGRDVAVSRLLCAGSAVRELKSVDLPHVDDYELGADLMATPHCVSARLTSIDFSSATPAGWTRTVDQVPAGFLVASLAAVVIRPLARGHLSPVAPMMERHVLVCVSRSVLDLQRLQAYRRACDDCKYGKGLLSIINMVEDKGLLFLEVAYPEGESVQEILDCDRSLDEAVGRIYCRQLMRTVAHLHRHALWLRGCIQRSAVFTSEDGSMVSVLPWAGLLSLYGLSHLASNFTKNDDVGIAPELLAASSSRGVSLSVVAKIGAAADAYAVTSLVFQAITRRGPSDVHDVAKESPLSAALFDLFIRSLQKDPLFRLDVRGVLEHPWLAGDA